jgi:hypothetical protein
MGKSSSWLMIAGGFVMLLGLCFMPAAFGEHADTTLLATGLMIFAFGTLFLAAGTYMKARALQGQSADASGAKPQAKRIRGGCDLCGTENPVIHCRVHALHICGNCVADHYDFRSCAYVPSTRRAAAAKPLARSARA